MNAWADGVRALVAEHLLAPGETVIAAREVREGVAVDTTGLTWLGAPVQLASLSSSGWRVMDLAPDLMSEPPPSREGFALRGSSRLRLTDPAQLGQFITQLPADVDPTDVADVVVRYAFPSDRHLLRHRRELATVVSEPETAWPDALVSPSLRCFANHREMELSIWWLSANDLVTAETWRIDANSVSVQLTEASPRRILHWIHA